MRRTVTYTVYAVIGDLIDTSTMAGPHERSIGPITIKAFGNDISLHEWELHPGEPQPLIGSTFRHEIELPETTEAA